MHTVIALDLGTHTGIAGCSFLQGERPRPWVSGIDIPGFPWRGQAFAHFDDKLRPILADWMRGDMEIVYEQAHHRGGAATRFALGLSAIVEMWAGRHGIPCYPVHTATIKQRTTGDGHASKAQMRAAAIQQGWLPVSVLRSLDSVKSIPRGLSVGAVNEQATEDEVDALCLLHCWLRDGTGMLGARERRAQARREKVGKRRKTV